MSQDIDAVLKPKMEKEYVELEPEPIEEIPEVVPEAEPEPLPEEQVVNPEPVIEEVETETTEPEVNVALVEPEDTTTSSEESNNSATEEGIEVNSFAKEIEPIVEE